MNKQHELLEYDYKFLQGNDEFWTVKGSAFNVVAKWNERRKYGVYGKPSDKGLEAMREYEKSREPVSN